MSTYVIPRKSDNQSRILYFFSIKGFMYMVIGIVIGFFVSRLIALAYSSMIVTGVCILIFGGIGLIIGEMKIPDTRGNAFFRNVGGEKIDDIILRSIKFSKSKKVYVYGKKKLD